MKNLLIFVSIMVFVVSAGKSFALTVPYDATNTECFYVSGPKGDPLLGADDHVQELYIDIPEDAEEDVKIGILDPDTGGYLDERESGSNPWDTTTEISLYGSKGLLNKMIFGEGEYDGETYFFDTLSKTDGVKVGNYYRFTLNVTATTGDDSNLFKVTVTPHSAIISSTNISFRLSEGEGTKIFFYPLIPEGTSQIIVENYDLDKDGGVSLLHDPAGKIDYEINDSFSGEWRQTIIDLTPMKKRYLDYVITKKTQLEAHAALRIKDAGGNLLPIYFTKLSLGGCNEFTFDATKSFDPDDQALTYRWDFGDGTVSNEPIVAHRFESGGDYNVTLAVQDTSGLDCDTAVSSRQIHVNTPPVADVTGPNTACTDQEVIFDASDTTDEDQDQITYQWDFGDGTGAEGMQVTKAYDKGGKYNVQLVVVDNSGTTCNTDGADTIITINTSPVANAGDDVDLCLQHNQEYRISFDGSGSADADGDILTYKWDFGDGDEATGANVTHVYRRRGEYVATIVVNDGSGTACSSNADTVNIKINKAPVAMAGDDIIDCQGTEISFDGSGSIGEDGEELKYEWDFGDGTTDIGTQVTHVYEKGGIYEAVLTVNDLQYTECSSDSDRVLVTVNSRPSPSFDTTSAACVGDEISFDAADTSDADGDNLTYTWNFGDGTEMQGGSQVTHAYKKGGNYSVKLTVNDNKGTNCSQDIASRSVRINTPPVADAGPNLVCCLDTVSDFDGSRSIDADGDALSYSWDFGDGATGEGARVTHVYTEIGKYFVTLTVNDNSGTACDTDTDSFTAVVNAKPTSIIEVR